MSNDTTITIVGNLTADPELRWTPSGAPVASFTIASTPRHFDRDTNVWKDGDPLFMRASIWRAYAENVAESLTKGMAVMATGRLKQRSYEDREGVKRTIVELDVEDIGPTLRFATAKVTKTARTGGQNQGGGQVQRSSSTEPGDAWATAGTSTAPATGWGAQSNDEPPF